MNVLEAFLHDPLVEWKSNKKPAESRSGIRTAAGRRAALADAGVPLSQKRLQGAAAGTDVAGAGSESVNENAQRIIHRIDQRLKGLYQRKVDLMLHDDEFARQAHKIRARLQRSAPIEGSTASYLANRLPLSIEGQVNQLLDEATDDRNLCNMYIGWMPFL